MPSPWEMVLIGIGMGGGVVSIVLLWVHIIITRRQQQQQRGRQRSASKRLGLWADLFRSTWALEHNRHRRGGKNEHSGTATTMATQAVTDVVQREQLDGAPTRGAARTATRNRSTEWARMEEGDQDVAQDEEEEEDGGGDITSQSTRTTTTTQKFNNRNTKGTTRKSLLSSQLRSDYDDDDDGYQRDSIGPDVIILLADIVKDSGNEDAAEAGDAEVVAVSAALDHGGASPQRRQSSLKPNSSAVSTTAPSSSWLVQKGVSPLPWEDLEATIEVDKMATTQPPRSATVTPTPTPPPSSPSSTSSLSSFSPPFRIAEEANSAIKPIYKRRATAPLTICIDEPFNDGMDDKNELMLGGHKLLGIQRAAGANGKGVGHSRRGKCFEDDGDDQHVEHDEGNQAVVRIKVDEDEDDADGETAWIRDVAMSDANVAASWRWQAFDLALGMVAPGCSGTGCDAGWATNDTGEDVRGGKNLSDHPMTDWHFQPRNPT